MSVFRSGFAWTLACGLAAAASDACVDRAPIVSTASVAASPDRVPIGGAVDLTLQFNVTPVAHRLPPGGRVLLRLLFEDGELMMNYDHEPPRGMGDWTAGTQIQYAHPIVLPAVPYVGKVYIAVGLSSPADDRLRLAFPAADEIGDRIYKAAALTVIAPPPQQ